MMELNLDVVAQSLEVSRATVERWIRQGRIPVRRDGEVCRFDQAAMDRWAQSHGLRFLPPQEAAANEGPTPAPDTLSGAMSAGGVFFDCDAQDAAGALAEAVGRMDFLSDAKRETLHKKLLERENLASTGVGKGVAIPHPRKPLPDFPDAPVITTCFLKHPVDFKAVDDRPVSVMFVLLSPTVKQHLSILSRLSYCLRDAAFIDFLKASPDPSDLLAKVGDFEERLESADSR
jgi:nitrogen PTS system EIIA component